MDIALKRIVRELQDFSKDPPANCSAGPKADDLFQWYATLMGPSGSPYEEGIYSLSVRFPPDYPGSPPVVTFDTPVWHPNIGKEGEVGLDILGENWSPALTLAKVMLSISSLLAEPDARDALREDVARELLGNRMAFDRKAREWKRRFAM